MKVHYILLIVLFLFSCQENNKKPVKKIKEPARNQRPKQKVQEREVHWKKFWLTFKKAVEEGDVKTVKANTIFPLPGSEIINNGTAIKEATFEANYTKLFDAKAVEIFTTATGNMSDFATSSESVAKQLKVPMNVKIRAITVVYVFNEGTDKQTESSMTFHFAEVEKHVFKLVSVIGAG